MFHARTKSDLRGKDGRSGAAWGDGVWGGVNKEDLPGQHATSGTAMATPGETMQLGQGKVGFTCIAVSMVALLGKQMAGKHAGRWEIWPYCNVRAALPAGRHAGVVVMKSEARRMWTVGAKGRLAIEGKIEAK